MPDLPLVTRSVRDGGQPSTAAPFRTGSFLAERQFWAWMRGQGIAGALTGDGLVRVMTPGGLRTVNAGQCVIQGPVNVRIVAQAAADALPDGP